MLKSNAMLKVMKKLGSEKNHVFLKKAPGDCETNSLIIEKETRGQFTDSYTLLTKDFYLNL